ncbi:MAG TPA: cytochrome c3 family protein [Pyrinomonadaceae bacterium]|nr:cytochrome c3 family protein [Pyrinomonadaceae bacterium]
MKNEKWKMMNGKCLKSQTIEWQLSFAKSLLLCLLLVSFVSAFAQTRKQRRRSTSPPPSTGTVDYARFLHSTKKHQQACNSCHKIPTSNWQKASTFPDTTDYPDHDACVRCHRSQFFKGARPVICTGCHTKVSPRDDARFPFRKSDNPRQFAIEFPHDKHQDVIALLKRQDAFRSAVVLAGNSRPLLAHQADDKNKIYNNCALCHTSRMGALVPPSAGWIDNFVPTVASFKSFPVDHAACFNCHWKSQQPVNTNCGGCHKLAEKPVMPDEVPKRISLKFRHDREQHVAECTTCHINITRAATLRGLKADVPITACTECHNKDGLRQDVNRELEALDKNRDFSCVYCHTSNVGRLDPPPGHYLIAGREPLKRKDLK